MTRPWSRFWVVAALLLGLALPQAARAGTAHIAVAANFTDVAEQLAPLFTAQTGHMLVLSFGSTGLLYAQISQGAPYEVLLAADSERPALAIAQGLAVAGSQYSYATGQLALYSTVLELGDGAAMLAEGTFERLAIADAQAAPYGRAAEQVIDRLGLRDRLAAKLVTGQNITQTLQFVETGNAELGLVARSQVIGQPGVWLVPQNLYEPIEQDAVLLEQGRDNPAALAFLRFLRGAAAQEVIAANGYLVGEDVL